MKRIMDSYRGRAGRYGTVLDRARRFRWRIRSLYGLFGVGFLLLAVRAANLMVMTPEILEERVQRQHQTVVELSPQRGMLFDRNGRVLAVSVDATSVVADPREVQAVDGRDDPAAREEAAANVREAARQLAPLLEVKESELREKLGRKNRFAWLGRQISDEAAAKIDALNLRGVFLRTEKRRAYPNRELAASILGFVNIEGRGLEGLERAWDDMLSGSSHRYVRMRDGRNRDVTSEAVVLRQSRGGGHLVLTLDLALQAAAESALRTGIIRTKAKGGFVLVLDPATGEILADAQQPGFNPNVFSRYDASVYKARVVTDVFEPGSTMKPFVVAAALEEGLIRPGEVFDCEGGRYKIGRHTIHDTHEYHALTVREIVKYSSNIGTAKIAERLGREKLHGWLKRFGFGESTRSGLPGEVNGLLRSPKNWSRVALATHAFGQGMSVTGMQLATALGALANGGRLMKPWLISEVVDEFGNVTERGAPTELHPAVREDVARTVASMMVDVTDAEGTAPLAGIPGYKVAGKTGTAQKVDPRTRRYGKGMYVSSFAGFLPADDPQLVIVASLDEPQGRWYYGGLVAAPIFRDVAMASIAYLGIPPTEEPKPWPGEIRALAQAVGVGLPDWQMGVQEEADDLVALAPLLTEPAFEPAVTEEGADPLGWVVPDFTGQPMREVLKALQGTDLDVVISGSGRAAAQVPLPGKVLSPGEALKLVFTPDPVRVAAADGGRR